MKAVSERTNPVEGKAAWSPVKSLWFTAHLVVASAWGWQTLSAGAAAMAFCFTVVTLCAGHTVGLHRLLIHRSFACPRWLEYFLVHLGTVVGMGGPFSMLYQHDIRDWAQRHRRCHPFYTDRKPWLRDAVWQLHCRLRLNHPPAFQIEPEVEQDRFYQFLQRTWMLQQLPYAALLLALGGTGWVVWGISVRIVVSLTGHWLIGYLAHNHGVRDWHLEGHAVQGFNVPRLGLLTMGECWHNNHHAFPESARLGLEGGQPDPGWWVLSALRRLGLVREVRLPGDLPPRPERVRVAVAEPRNSGPENEPPPAAARADLTVCRRISEIRDLVDPL